MSRFFSYLAAAGFIAIAATASAQEVTQTISSVGYASTTYKTPNDTTTKIVRTEVPSTMAHLKDGTKIEMDSDHSVYVVYPDTARVALFDGMHTLENGQVITTKDGKIIP